MIFQCEKLIKQPQIFGINNAYTNSPENSDFTFFCFGGWGGGIRG